MFNEYVITIIKEGDNSHYICSIRNRIIYRVKYINCACGIIFPEPIISSNSDIHLTLHMEGSIVVPETTLVIESRVDSELKLLTEEVCKRHPSNQEVIHHILIKAKEVFNNNHNGNYNIRKHPTCTRVE